MKILNIKLIDKYIKKKKDKDLSSSILNWIKTTKKSQWQTKEEIRDNYTKVSILPHSRVVFNISGNNYRLVVVVVIVAKTIRIEWIGDHEEYDRIDLTKRLIKIK